MSWINYFRIARSNSARTAKERLQIVIAHERIDRDSPSYLPRLKRDILEVIRRYIAVDEDQVKIQMEQDGDMDILALNIQLPDVDYFSEHYTQQASEQ
ncbi:cell division topological specificity factor MinE [Candidatus Nitrosoglobus terrae]|uniref:Cell division topological specificity factor n=1 Tax=Candidatus Nitrosoglobus terrae TaxID=1630141 RepID=A0A1Q2SPZ4_9GAMM|nr:cell division topological specificity factor MinE [Candidatus Nitrosoglobus terrae]BAW81183.1 cell division topological specificity factor MinE [Candidatus Nitrosoglobus terrae]